MLSALSPEGDPFPSMQKRIEQIFQEMAEAPEFEKARGLHRFSQFEIETVVNCVPDANAAQEFYSKIEDVCWTFDLYRSRGSHLKADNALPGTLTMPKAQVNRLETGCAASYL